jgi:hypothetical protein
VLFLDEFTSYTTVYCLTKRSEIPDKFKHFKVMVENFHDVKIVFLRVDNAPEFVEGELRKICEESGIIYERTVPDAPQQNGKSERHNYTYGCMARAMLIDAGLSEWFWPFAIQMAVYLRNRIPHSALPPNTTPYQPWFGHKPNIAHLRPFGAHCTSRRVNTTLSKFEPRGEHGRMLGYAPQSKGYIVWLPSSRSVRIRRDLIFHGQPTLPLGQGGVGNINNNNNLET